MYPNLPPRRAAKSWPLALSSNTWSKVLHLKEVWVRCVTTTNVCSLNHKMRHILQLLRLRLEERAGVQSRWDSHQAPAPAGPGLAALKVCNQEQSMITEANSSWEGRGEEGKEGEGWDGEA